MLNLCTSHCIGAPSVSQIIISYLYTWYIILIFLLIIFLLILIQKIQLFKNNIYIFILKLNIYIFIFLHFYVKSIKFNKILIKMIFAKKRYLYFIIYLF